MVASARALVSGADEVVCAVEGGTYRQAPSNIRASALRLRDDCTLESEARDKVDVMLEGTGCEVLFDSDISPKRIDLALTAAVFLVVSALVFIRPDQWRREFLRCCCSLN